MTKDLFDFIIGEFQDVAIKIQPFFYSFVNNTDTILRSSVSLVKMNLRQLLEATWKLVLVEAEGRQGG